jgi:hypothetical protein
MTEIAKGRGVRVEIGYTEGAPKTVTSVSLSDPGIAVSTAHGLAVGSAGYFDDVVGMDPLDGQAARVGTGGSPNADEIQLEDLNTTDFPDFTSGTFVPITAWSTLSQSTQYQLGGGAPKTEDIGTLLDTIEKLETIKLAAETVTIDVRSLTTDNQAMAKIRSTARALGRLVFRITHPDGSQRLFRGQPSIPGESLAQGATGTGQLTVTVKGQILYLAPQ